MPGRSRARQFGERTTAGLDAFDAEVGPDLVGAGEPLDIGSNPQP